MLDRNSLIQSVALVVWLAAPCALNAARAADASPVIVTPAEDFTKKFEEFKTILGDLRGKIDKSREEIEKLTTLEDARKEIGVMQGMIADALGAVADNGDVAKIGQKALEFARSKQRQFETDTKFSPEERQYLLGEWKRVGGEIERAAGNIATARGEFAQLLGKIQTRGDYIEELQALKNAQRVVDVIKMLDADLRAASGVVRNVIQSATPPSPGI